jgi:hypothetical protein
MLEIEAENSTIITDLEGSFQFFIQAEYINAKDWHIFDII